MFDLINSLLQLIDYKNVPLQLSIGLMLTNPMAMRTISTTINTENMAASVIDAA